jgi:hypothetical protein
MAKGFRNLSAETLFAIKANTTLLLFIAGIAMAVVGGLSGNVVLLGVGLGIAVVITVGGVVIRERNIGS